MGFFYIFWCGKQGLLAFVYTFFRKICIITNHRMNRLTLILKSFTIMYFHQLDEENICISSLIKLNHPPFSSSVRDILKTRFPLRLLNVSYKMVYLLHSSGVWWMDDEWMMNEMMMNEMNDEWKYCLIYQYWTYKCLAK